jgi:hypothetical protein
MHQSLFRLPPQQDPLPMATLSLWQRLPAPQRQQCHELIAQLFLAVVRSQPSKESSHERQD